MIKNIVKGEQIFSKKATPATEADRQVITDLLDTLRANREICVGMAANMIGVNKAIIVVAAGPFQFAMVNPVITKKSGEYQTEESCLSLDGARNCTRYKEIEVDYLDQNFKPQHGKCNLLEYLTQRDIQTKNSGVNVRYRGKHRFFKGFNEFIKEKTRRCDNDFEKIERHVFF